MLVSVSNRVVALKTILISLNKGEVLTEQQREEVMENLLETSIGHLKRRGVLPTGETLQSLTQEVSYMPPEDQKVYDIDQPAYTSWLQRNGIQSSEDFLNISVIAYFRGVEMLETYAVGKVDKDLPELSFTNGLLIYREDWLRILMRLTGCNLTEAIEAHKVFANKIQTSAGESLLSRVLNSKIRDLLIKEAPKVFLKSHMVRSWWYYKRTAILKSLWTDFYLKTIGQWEQKNGIIWQEFGYKRPDGSLFLKA